MNQEQILAALEARTIETVEALFGLLDSLPEGDLYATLPVKDPNSIPGIIMHVLGSVEERVVWMISGQPSTRDREAELQTSGLDRAAIHARWSTIRPRLHAAFRQAPDGYLDEVFDHQRMGRVTRFDAILNVIRHANEHLGEAQLIRDMLTAGTLR